MRARALAPRQVHDDSARRRQDGATAVPQVISVQQQRPCAVMHAALHRIQALAKGGNFGKVACKMLLRFHAVIHPRNIGYSGHHGVRISISASEIQCVLSQSGQGRIVAYSTSSSPQRGTTPVPPSMPAMSSRYNIAVTASGLPHGAGCVR